MKGIFRSHAPDGKCLVARRSQIFGNIWQLLKFRHEPFQLLKLLETSLKQGAMLIQEFPGEKVSKCQTFTGKPGALSRHQEPFKSSQSLLKTSPGSKVPLALQPILF